MPRAATDADVFNAIAEARRRAILEYLAPAEHAVGDIADALDMAQPSASKHLQVLRNVGLVTVRREGPRIFYRTNAEALRPLHEWSGTFAQYWHRQLTRIKQHAERRSGPERS